MTVPKKPLTKNESAIQLGNVLKYASRGGSTKAGILSKIKKLLIKPKPTKNSNPIKEVKKAKKSLQNQKVAKPTRSATEVKANHDVFNRAVVGRNLRTHSGGTASEIGAIKRYIKARGPFSPRGLEKTSGIPSSTGRLLKQKKVLKNQKVNKSAKKEVPTSAVVNRISRIYNKGKK